MKPQSARSFIFDNLGSLLVLASNLEANYRARLLDAADRVNASTVPRSSGSPFAMASSTRPVSGARDC